MEQSSEKGFYAIEKSRTSCGYGSFFIIKTPEGEKELKDEDSGDVYQVKLSEGVSVPCVLNVWSRTTDQREGAWERVTSFVSLSESNSLTISASNGLMVKKDEKLSKINRARESKEEALKEKERIQEQIDELIKKRTSLENEIVAIQKEIESCE